MSWISPLEMNMNITRNIYEGRSDNCLISTAQKVAIYSIVPLMLVAMFESILKNFIFINLANLVITVANAAYDRCVRPSQASS